MTDISKAAVERLAVQLEKRDEEHLEEAERHSWNAADTLRAQAAEIERLRAKIAWMEQIDREAIVANRQAQLATARREGAEEMRERAAEAMQPMLRSMLSRGEAQRMIRALPLPGDTRKASDIGIPISGGAGDTQEGET